RFEMVVVGVMLIPRLHTVGVQSLEGCHLSGGQEELRSALQPNVKAISLIWYGPRRSIKLFEDLLGVARHPYRVLADQGFPVLEELLTIGDRRIPPAEREVQLSLGGEPGIVDVHEYPRTAAAADVNAPRLDPQVKATVEKRPADLGELLADLVRFVMAGHVS